MKKERGFTLVELLGVLIILAILLVIIVSSTQRYLKKGTSDYYHNLEKTLLLSGKDYLNDYRTLLPIEIGNVRVIELKELEDNKYIEKVVDSNGKECQAKVVAKKIGKNKYEYYTCLICEGYQAEGEACKYSEDENISEDTNNYKVEVEDTGNYEIDENGFYIVDQGKDFELPKANVYYKDKLESNEIEARPNSIDTTKLMTYTIKYYYKGAKTEIRVKVVDRVAPSIPQIILRKESKKGKQYVGGWYSGNIYAEYQAIDYSKKEGVLGSGIAYYEISTDGVHYSRLDSNYKMDTEDGKYSYYVRAVDKSGNIGESNTYELKIDRKVPTCKLRVASGVKGNNDWYLGNVRVEFENTDGTGSEIPIRNITSNKEKIINGNITEEGIHTISGVVTDEAGNVGGCSITVKIDKTKPECSFSGDSTTWINSNRTIYYGCSDNNSGCNSSYSGGNKTFSDTIQIGNIESYMIKDNAGNTTICPSRSANVYVDKTKPECTSSGDSTTWINSNRTIYYGCSDSDSGCNSNYRGGSKIFSDTIQIGNIESYMIKDNAGNTTVCPSRSANVYVDKIKPECSFSGESTQWTSGNRTIEAVCTDAHSKCTAATASKTWTYTSGTHKVENVSYTIMDQAGNSTLCSKNINVYVDQEKPTVPTIGDIGEITLNGSNIEAEIKTKGGGSTDSGRGTVTYKYLIKNDSGTPDKNDTRFTTSSRFTRSCGTSYYAWVIAEDEAGNRSEVKYIGTTSDGPNVYSNWGSCSKTCGGGIQTRTNTCALVTSGLSQSCNTHSCSYAATPIDASYTATGRSKTVDATATSSTYSAVYQGNTTPTEVTETCPGDWYTPYGTHYIHICRICGEVAANMYWSNQDATPGASCGHYGSHEIKKKVCSSGTLSSDGTTCLGSGYGCPYGGTLNGTTCYTTTYTCPNGVHPTYSYSSYKYVCNITEYSCPNGGTLSGTTCLKTNYTCPNGGRLSGTICVFD